MTDAEKLATVKSQILDRLMSVTASDQPSYTEGGRAVSKNEYLDVLMRQLDLVDKALSRAEPVEVVTQVRPV